MAPNPGRGKAGKPRCRFVEPSAMLTRQGRKTDSMEDKVIAALQAAGIENVEGMDEQEKMQFFQVIQTSMGSPSDDLERSPNPDSYDEQASTNDIVMEAHVGTPNRSFTAGQPGASQTPKNVGRGRAKPVRTKYPSLPINCNPGQKPDPLTNSPSSSKPDSSINHLSSPMSPYSPTRVPSSESPAPVMQNSPPGPIPTDDTAALDSSIPMSPASQSIRQESPAPGGFGQDLFDDLLPDEGIAQVDDDDVLVDVESGGTDRGSVQDHGPDSPASVQDAAEEEKDTVKTVLVGKMADQVSPLEFMNRGLPLNAFSMFLKDLEKYKDNKALWMAKASEKVNEERRALIQQLEKDNPIWGPPITDGGAPFSSGGSNSKRTLYKNSAPKFSDLFSNSSEKQGGTTSTSLGRNERQAKLRAGAKILEAIDYDCETEFRSLRRSRQTEARNKPSNAWNSRKQQDVEINDDACMDDAPSVDKRPSNRSEQKEKSIDGDFDPDSPKVCGSSDVYNFKAEDEDEEDPEIWETAPNRNKKNPKRGNRSAQADVEVEGRMQPRPRGAGVSQQNPKPTKSTKLRLQKGTIAHPSQHGQIQRQKGGLSEKMEGETNARNSANNEGRWLSSPRADSENSPEISVKSFYSKAVQPRTSIPQARRSRDTRPDDSPSSPSTSGNSSEKMQCPICAKPFPADQIETHASDCYQEAPAVGE